MKNKIISKKKLCYYNSVVMYFKVVKKIKNIEKNFIFINF